MANSLTRYIYIKKYVYGYENQKDSLEEAYLLRNQFIPIT